MNLRQLAYNPRHFGPISLAFQAGEFVLICGPSGSGKSTLCQLLAGELEPSGGDVSWLDIGGTDGSPPSCGYISQDVEVQLLGATVEQELQLGAPSVRRLQNETPDSDGESQGWAWISERFREKHRVDPHTLSAGEQQLLLLASLALADHGVLILDEGLSQLDEASFVEVCLLLRGFASRGILVLVVSHEFRVFPWADRCVGLFEGRLAFDRPTTEFTWDDVGRSLMWVGSLTPRHQRFQVLSSSNSTLVSEAVRKAQRLSPLEGEARGALPLMSHGRRRFSLPRGGSLAVAGLSGSGKSRLLSTLLGQGEDWGRWTREDDEYRVMLRQKPQNALWGRNVREDLMASAREGLHRRGVAHLQPDELSEIPPDWLERSPRALSYGQTKLVACLCLLLQSPDLLLLDEPFQGLDSDLREKLVVRLRDYLGGGGRLVFSSHHTDEMALYPDRLLVLDNGEPAWWGDAWEYFDGAPHPGLGRPYCYGFPPPSVKL